MVKLLDIDSNTTLVKVKLEISSWPYVLDTDSNTTLVKVKFFDYQSLLIAFFIIQIQHLLKLNSDAQDVFKNLQKFKYNTC